MDMIFQGITIALLLVIAVELVLLRRDLTMVYLKRQSGWGKFEGNEENPQPEQPPLNPNGEAPALRKYTKPPSAPNHTERESTLSVAVQTNTEDEHGSADKPETIAPQGGKVPPSPPRAPVPASSAPLILKCPKCGGENSSYRTECFNCGAQLQ